jgi:small conductance mechanosensitive channel
MAIGVSSAQLHDACGAAADRTWLCTQVYRITGSRRAGEVADGLSTPIRIALVVVLALVAIRVLGHLINRSAERLREEGTFTKLRRRAGLADQSSRARLRRAQRAETIGAVLHSAVTVVIGVIVFLVVLGEIGISLAPLIAGAGIAGVAIGIGAQSLVRDCLAGLFVVLEDQYGVGDLIDAGVATGTVEFVSLRLTRLRDADGVAWHVPNGEIRRVGNFSQTGARPDVVGSRPVPDADGGGDPAEPDR